MSLTELSCGCFALFLSGCGGKESPARTGAPAIPFTAAAASNAFHAAETLVKKFVPRDAGTPGARQTALWLADELWNRGVPAEIDSFNDQTPRGEKTFHNVLGSLRGDGKEWIILLSHFDTMSGIGAGFQGANDGASSTGLLLELARVLHAASPQRLNFLFGFMDGEECMLTYGTHDGFHGSKRLARKMKADGRKIIAVILMDMIGDKDLKITVPRNATPALRVLALEAAEAVGERDRIGLFDGYIYDDHQAFLDAGFPAVNLIDFSYGSAPGKNDYWHTLQDTLDELSPDSFLTTGKIVLEMIRQLEAKPEGSLSVSH